MEVIVSAAVSSDGYLDDCTPRRLVLSCAEDWAEVHRLRAWCDAILVGAETVRRDNPSLVIRDAGLRIWREWLGMKPDLTKVTVTAGGSLDAGARFFTEGPGAEKIVVTVPAVRRGLEERLPSGVRVVALEEITAGGILDALEPRVFRNSAVCRSKVVRRRSCGGWAIWRCTNTLSVRPRTG